MKRSQGEYVRDAVAADFGGSESMANGAIVIRVNGHERLLYSWKDAKLFVFPKPYPTHHKVPSDKYDEKKAWATALANPPKAMVVICKSGNAVKAGNCIPRCPECGLEAIRWGWTYAVCGNGCTRKIFAF